MSNPTLFKVPPDVVLLGKKMAWLASCLGQLTPIKK